MENSKKIICLLIVLILLLVIALFYTVCCLNKFTEVPFVVPEEIQNTVLVDNKAATEKVISSEDVVLLQKNIGDTFKESILENENVEEVVINRMTFYDGKELSELINEEYDPDKFFVDISYNIKVKDVQAGLAGNGEEGEDNWIVEKSACTILTRDGNTFTIQSSGTGW